MTPTATAARRTLATPPAPVSPFPYNPGSLLSVLDLTVEGVSRLLARATELEQMDPLVRDRILAKRRLALLFYESSTRTRTSFELAAKALGADTTLVSSLSSSIEKGESVKDTGLTLRALGAEAIIIRHNASGAAWLLEASTRLPVINAGDGTHEHPTQALLDLRTILSHFEPETRTCHPDRRVQVVDGPAPAVDADTLSGATICIVGDILHSRVARSNMLLLPRLGGRVILCGPKELLPEQAARSGPGIEIERDFDAALRQSQVVMMLRIQAERLAGLQLDLDEYKGNYQLTGQRLAAHAPSALVLHPGPIIRGLEITAGVADGPQSAILEQVTNGVVIRMAVIERALLQMQGVLRMTAIAIRGGRLIDPAAGVDGLKDVLLKDGRVAEIAGPGKLKGADGAEMLDATDLVVAPGLIDIHVHLREPGQAYKETIATGTAAAAAGGFTAVAAMPNTVPVNDSPEITRWMQQPERGAQVRVFPIAAATRGLKGETINDYAALKAVGAVAVTDDGHPILKDSIMRETLIAAARAGLSVIQHAEDTRLTQGASMNLGPVSFRLGLRGMPPDAESSLVERDIRLVTELRDAHPHLHVAHTSTAAALNAVRQARRNGLRLTCEVAPHHFLLTEEHVGLYDTHAKMNPPLRSAADRDAMIEGILDGVVDAIATDHAPHAQHEKEVEFELAPSGITGLETALGLALKWLHGEWKMPLGRVLSLMSAQPAALLGIKGRGTLSAGSFADVVVFDPRAEWTYRATESKSKAKNTPFDGWTMQGRVFWTISEGHIAYASREARAVLVNPA